MDAMEYIEERNRMCRSQGSECKKCPANFDNMFCCGVAAISTLDAKEQIAIVEKWSAEHPKKQKKTRQDVFLKQYPGARIDVWNTLCVCPADVYGFEVCPNSAEGNSILCCDCRRKFWTQEVEEDK